MSGKVENRSRGKFAPDRAERGFSAFERTRGMKVAGDGVRFRGDIGQRNESICWRRSGAAHYQGPNVCRNTGVVVQPRLRILTE